MAISKWFAYSHVGIGAMPCFFAYCLDYSTITFIVKSYVDAIRYVAAQSDKSRCLRDHILYYCSADRIGIATHRKRLVAIKVRPFQRKLLDHPPSTGT